MSKRNTFSREYNVGAIQMVEQKKHDNARSIGGIRNKRRNAVEVAKRVQGS